ncbi:MAG: hypothetical protein ACREQ4_07955 [Candidatus Binataceae bacterium]
MVGDDSLDGAAVDGSAAGACAKAGTAIAPANSAAVRMEIVRFMSQFSLSFTTILGGSYGA